MKNNLVNFQISERNDENMSKKSQMKVNDLIPLWLNNLEVSVKPSTFSTYQVILKNHIIDTIGKLKIEELNKQAIDQFIIQQMMSLYLIIFI